MARKYFGTDGVRGKVGEFPITPDFVLKLGWAAGRVLAEEGEGKVIIGKDTRISGYMFESALEAGLSAAGIDVVLTGPMPTPAIAYLTRTFNGQAGIVISASHNPFYDNGIKFFAGDGTKLSDDVEQKIEALLESEIDVVDSQSLGKVTRMNDAAGRYIEYCKGSTSQQLDLRGMKMVIDAGHGATYQVGPAVFCELGAEVITMGTHPDGVNINENAGSTNPEGMAARVRETGADLGIAFDGDGDRVIMVDDQGEIVDGDQLLFIIAMDRHSRGILNGGVVGTLMTNLGMEKALEAAGIPFARAKVGDRYVNELLIANDWQLGGESSGHIICRDASTTGDGIVSALKVLKAMQTAGQSLSEMVGAITLYPQVMINVRVQNKRDTDGIPGIVDAVKKAEREMAGKGRVLLRPSGTEPVIRVMVEGEDGAQVKAQAEQLAKVVEQEMC
ncbi:phosphoglucosamine mutase [Endozoicomonas sp. SCSIO W0465]|uniref:phosphoglucosamine mutase n=1 Tax=Endozoicomonas sp. SCSIO W0465 TaxID=2918516 RepID=UPI0020762E0B|nr:phosphoglucosamine mutase [Endozoicomonas sp. SCSIO W0465]USE39594.1 phosphoglucosamine mutase [Endozoicomonas sp. SCSIO W0465]